MVLDPDSMDIYSNYCFDCTTFNILSKNNQNSKFYTDHIWATIVVNLRDPQSKTTHFW